MAPDTPKAWDGLDAGVWLVFEAVNGMTLDGLGNKGGFNGNGKGWWDQSCRYHPDLVCMFSTTLRGNATDFLLT